MVSIFGSGSLIHVLQLLLATQYACTSTGQLTDMDEFYPADAAVTCNCDLENKLQFVTLVSRVREHSVPTIYTIDVRVICERDCVVFGRLPSTPPDVHQGNWSIERDGTIRFEHKPHKTGAAVLNITAEEVYGSNDTVHTAYRVVIEEDPDWPIVFASKDGLAVNQTRFDNITEQFQNVTFSVEQNTGNNTAYADLRFTAGCFDYDSDENIGVVVLSSGEQPRLGQIVTMAENSSAQLLEPVDCNLPDGAQRLRNRSLTEWDADLPRWYPCGLTPPYPASELSWFDHLLRYRPGLQQAGLDRFALTYTDKYGLQAKLFVHVHILVNPCINEGRCWGPSWDPNCTNHVRSSGFFNNGYLCSCETGWVGDRCEIDFDDCSSSPCPSPYVCVDKFRGYECVCPENHVRCQPILKPWQLSATILGIVAGVCAVAAILILASQRAPVILTLSKISPKQPQTPPPAVDSEAAAAEQTTEVTEFGSDLGDGGDAAADVDLPEPAEMPPPPVVTFADAEIQADPPEPSPEPEPTPPPTPPPRPPRRPSKPNPKAVPEDRYSQVYKRGSIFVPKRPAAAWTVSQTPLFEGDDDPRRGSSATIEDADDAIRLREMRQAVRNRQQINDF